jgi:hypothetical protein
MLTQVLTGLNIVTFALSAHLSCWWAAFSQRKLGHRPLELLILLDHPTGLLIQVSSSSTSDLGRAASVRMMHPLEVFGSVSGLQCEAHRKLQLLILHTYDRFRH